jgi:hypothetical protein
MALELPAGWTFEDIQFLIEKVKSWPVVLVEDQALGIPTTQCIPPEAISESEYGVVEAITEKYTVVYVLNRTPSGKGWAHVDVISGDFPYNKAAILEHLRLLVEAHPINADADPKIQVPNSDELVATKETLIQKTGNKPEALENNIPVQSLTFLEQGKRVMAFNNNWMAICCSSIDRATGEIRCGQWRMYHANFVGVLDPATDQQVIGPDLWAITIRICEIYGILMKLEEVPDWIKQSKSTAPDLSTHPP